MESIDTLSPSTENGVEKPLSVNQLNRQAKHLLETQLPMVWVEGEISNLARPSSGHWYFTLKDSQAQIRCAMFRGRNSRLRWRPEAGNQVIARGRVSLYEGRGDYQLIVDNLTPAGEGALQLAFDQLKRKLHGEGLFEAHHKQPLPEQIQRLAVITSATGAAVKDILTILQRRAPWITVDLIPVPVQGQDAPAAIVRALQAANQSADIDAIIVGRGGGSLEDLWGFNDERVARAIFDSHHPVISAVGHEVDVSIADWVADVRAATPSAAAELVSPVSLAQRQQQLRELSAWLLRETQRQIELGSEQLKHLQQRLRHPGHLLQEQIQRLDLLELRLLRAQEQRLVQHRQQCQQTQHRLSQYNPQQTITLAVQQQNNLQQRLLRALQQQLQQQQQSLHTQMQLLNLVSPLATLQRGYAIVSDVKGPISDSDKVQVGEQIHARLAHGELVCRVESKQGDK